MTPKNQLAVAIRTMSQDIEATKKGAKPTARLEEFTPNPPETLPVEPIGLKSAPRPLPAPAAVKAKQEQPQIMPRLDQRPASPRTDWTRPSWLPPEPSSKLPTPQPAQTKIQAQEAPRPAPRPAGPLTDPVRPAFSQTPKPPTPPKPSPHPTGGPPPASAPEALSPRPTAPRPPTNEAPKPPPTKDDRQKIVAIVLAAALVLTGSGGALWWFWLKPSTPAPSTGSQPPPTPAPLTTPAPLLAGFVSQTAESATTTGIPQSVSRLASSMATETQSAANQVMFVKIKGADATRYATASDVITGYGLRIPEQIRPAIADLNLIWHKQSEVLSLQPSPDRSRFGFVIKLRSLANATENLRAWEQTLPADLNQYLQIGRFYAPTEQTQWHDSDYRGIQIRYANFPLADQSIDYAILSGDNLLLIATSRENMYGLIDAALTPRSQ